MVTIDNLWMIAEPLGLEFLAVLFSLTVNNPNVYSLVQVHNLMDIKDLPALNSSLSSSFSSTRVLTLDIGAEEWEVAEEGVDEILCMIQPNVISSHRRKEIIEYIQILFGSYYGIKVFPLGSVPLKTYLPDGDIDLTVVCHHDEELMMSVFCSRLENEEMTNTEIQVRKVQSIPAQVKVVKCYVDNISVDISFNQTAGLCALSFLEQVDQLFGKDHLFKRSVILIKSWSFYDSRILGAHYGLISTYGLETMIIHIINLFHSTLSSPLAVFYKFLTYFSKFDWDEYCLSISGVILLSSLPEVVVQPLEGSDDPFLSADFLKKCEEAYSVSTGFNQTGQDQFPTKFLNIMDPLSSINNLGRSINKANFSRIKSVLSYASKKLEAIFFSPVDKISEGLANFFRTTLRRNIKRTLPDVVPVKDLSDEKSDPSETSDENENLLSGIQFGLWSHYYGMYQGDTDPMSPQNFSRVAKSRGTGTYIPKPVQMSEWISIQRSRRAESPRPSIPVTEEAETSNAKDGIKLSLTEFPRLPGTKPAEINNGNPTESETSRTPKQVASPVLPKLSCPDSSPALDFLTIYPPLAKDEMYQSVELSLTEFPRLPGRKPVEISNDNPTEPETTQTPKQLASPVLPKLSCPGSALDSLTIYPPLVEGGIYQSVELSLTEFPPLPGTKPVEINNDNPTESETTQVPKQVASPAIDSLTVYPPLSVLEEKLQDESKKIRVEEPSVRLDDQKEFPELPILRLQDPVGFPDLPTLRLRDPKDFPPLSKKQQKGVGHSGKKKD